MKKLLVLLSLFVSAYAIAQDEKKEESTVKSKGSVVVDGKTIEYSAQTGYMEIKNGKDEHIANLFYVAYTKSGEDDAKKRPVTFVFNGGPGSSSVWLHMGVMGPKRVKMAENGDALAAPYELISNDCSWLDLTDLVFIDPIGTGFSRAVGEHKPEQFYGFENDVKSVSEFIRLWTVENERWGSPKYLAGESYGTTRACGVVDYLQEEFQMHINGVTLLSCALDFQALRQNSGNPLPFVFNLPVMALTAKYHNKLSPPVQAMADSTLVKNAERFAIDKYSVALLKGDNLSEREKHAIAEELAYFTGISKDVYIVNDLAIYTWQFRKLLLEDQKLLVGRYDSRLTMPNPDPAASYAYKDPSFTQIGSAITTAFNEYVQSDLKYTNDEVFNLIGNVYPWKFADSKYLNVVPKLRNAMFTNPNLKVWVLNGKYDIATPMAGTKYALSQMYLPESLEKNITIKEYEAGHMMYLLKSELQKMKNDAKAFYK